VAYLGALQISSAHLACQSGQDVLRDLRGGTRRTSPISKERVSV
jgi:hypothetical protein